MWEGGRTLAARACRQRGRWRCTNSSSAATQTWCTRQTSTHSTQVGPVRERLDQDSLPGILSAGAAGSSVQWLCVCGLLCECALYECSHNKTYSAQQHYRTKPTPVPSPCALAYYKRATPPLPTRTADLFDIIEKAVCSTSCPERILAKSIDNSEDFPNASQSTVSVACKHHSASPAVSAAPPDGAVAACAGHCSVPSSASGSPPSAVLQSTPVKTKGRTPPGLGSSLRSVKLCPWTEPEAGAFVIAPVCTPLSAPRLSCESVKLCCFLHTRNQSIEICIRRVELKSGSKHYQSHPPQKRFAWIHHRSDSDRPAASRVRMTD